MVELVKVSTKCEKLVQWRMQIGTREFYGEIPQSRIGVTAHPTTNGPFCRWKYIIDFCDHDLEKIIGKANRYYMKTLTPILLGFNWYGDYQPAHPVIPDGVHVITPPENGWGRHVSAVFMG